MHSAISVSVERAKLLSADAEAALLQEALTKNPESAALKRKLGQVLNESDRFTEVIALFAPTVDTLDCHAARHLARACFALPDTGHLQLADRAASRARATASGNASIANALADQAKVSLRFGNDAAAITKLREAIDRDPDCVSAFKRLAVQLLRQQQPAEVEQLTRNLIAKGVSHSRVLAARTMALAAMGRDEEARATAGIEHYLHHTEIRMPGQIDSLHQFNSRLSAELTGSPDIRHDRFGTASSSTQRLDSPAIASTPLWIAHLEEIARTVENWVGQLPSSDHPWLAARPKQALLRSWCVITGADGFERWHMHPDGWLSGGYYPAIPPAFESEKAGCIAFGLPDGLPGAEAAARFGEVLVRPQAGELFLFPSHVYHRTYPHGSAGRRICIAFDIIPV